MEEKIDVPRIEDDPRESKSDSGIGDVRIRIVRPTREA
jgi:hypothetical protein